MIEMGSNNLLVFSEAGYSAQFPGGVPIHGAVREMPQGIWRDSGLGGSRLTLMPGASMAEAGLYAGLMAARQETPVVVVANTGLLYVDPKESLPPLDAAQREVVLRRFGRIATGLLECRTPISDQQRVRAGEMAVRLVVDHRKAEFFNMKAIRESGWERGRPAWLPPHI